MKACFPTLQKCAICLSSCALGLPVYITEMDMTAYHMYDPTTVYKWEDREKVKDAVARAYATTFDIFREKCGHYRMCKLLVPH